MTQLSQLRDRLMSGGYRLVSTSDLAQVIDAIRLAIGDQDPVAPTQTAGGADAEATLPGAEAAAVDGDSAPTPEPDPVEPSPADPAWGVDP